MIYIGDAPSDILASKKTGIAVIAAAWTATSEPKKLIALEPDEIFYTTEEFSEWLLQNI